MRDYQELEAAVQRGADLMDATDADWPAKVDVIELNMSSCQKCVLGHIYGDYWDACKILLAENDSETLLRKYGVGIGRADFGIYHGFDIDADAIGFLLPGIENREERSEHRAAEYQTLKDLWVKQINSRLG